MKQRATRLARHASTLALVSVAGCDRSIENPRPPDTEPLQATYDLPPGHLSSASIAETAKDFARRLQLMAETDDLGLVTDVLTKAEESGLIADPSQLDPSERPKRLLTVHVTHVCRGDDPSNTEVDPERFGTMTMELKASEHGLFPVAWGTFDRCVEPGAGAPVTLDGDYFAAIRSASLPGEVDILYAFSGVLTSKAVSYTGDLDFRLLADGATEVRVHGADGDVIVGIDGAVHEIARDVVGQWTCELSKLRCTNSETKQVVMP